MKHFATILEQTQVIRFIRGEELMPGTPQSSCGHTRLTVATIATVLTIIEPAGST